MGVEICTYFELQTDTGWSPVWGRSPNPHGWHETILNQKISDGGIGLVIEPRENEKREDAIKRYFYEMPLEQAIAEYGNDPRFLWFFNFPDTIAPFFHTWFPGRDYAWFAALASVRGKGQTPKGLPEDISPEVQQAAKYYGEEGYSHSWMMVSDILKNPDFQIFTHKIEWLRKYIKQPENTRFVFWFRD